MMTALTSPFLLGRARERRFKKQIFFNKPNFYTARDRPSKLRATKRIHSLVLTLTIFFSKKVFSSG